MDARAPRPPFGLGRWLWAGLSRGVALGLIYPWFVSLLFAATEGEELEQFFMGAVIATVYSVVLAPIVAVVVALVCAMIRSLWVAALGSEPDPNLVAIGVITAIAGALTTTMRSGDVASDVVVFVLGPAALGIVSVLVRPLRPSRDPAGEDDPAAHLVSGG